MFCCRPAGWIRASSLTNDAKTNDANAIFGDRTTTRLSPLEQTICEISRRDSCRLYRVIKATPSRLASLLDASSEGRAAIIRRSRKPLGTLAASVFAEDSNIKERLSETYDVASSETLTESLNESRRSRLLGAQSVAKYTHVHTIKSGGQKQAGSCENLWRIAAAPQPDGRPCEGAKMA